MKNTIHQKRIAIVGGVCLLMLALAFGGCGNGAEGSRSSLTGVQAATTEPTPPPEILHLVVCYDASSSYPEQLRLESMSSVGGLLDALVFPGFSGAHVHERWITHKTRSAEAELTDWEMRSIPGSPVRAADPPAPTPPDPADPQYLYDKEAYGRAYDEYVKQLAEWQAQVDANEMEFEQANLELDVAIAAAHEAVRMRNEHVRSVVPPLSDGSDLGGCFQKASDVLSRVEGREVLVVASDMEMYGAQDVASVALNEVEVHIIYFYCEQATDCDQRRQEWATFLGAVPVHYYDPDEDISAMLKEEN